MKIYFKKILAIIAAIAVTAVLSFSVCAEGEAELLDRNRNNGIGSKSYAEIIAEATADIDLEEYEKSVKNIEICAEEYELVYEYYFDDLQTFPKTQYDEIIKNSQGLMIYVPVMGEVEGTRRLVGQIVIHCKDGETSKVTLEFAQIFNDGRVLPFYGVFLEQRALLDEITVACKEKGATQITDAFFVYTDNKHNIIKAMVINTNVDTLVYEFGYNDYSDGFYLYTVEEFIEFCNKIVKGHKWSFWQVMAWAGYLPIIIPAVALVLLAIIVITVILITKKIRRKRATPPEAEA